MMGSIAASFAWRRAGPGLAVALAAVLFAGCLDHSSLDGSVSEVFDLSFDRVEIEGDGELLIIRYLADVEYPEVAYYATNTVAELAIEVGPDGWKTDGPEDVTDRLELERYVMTMDEEEEIVEDGRDFPVIYVAEVTFDVLGGSPGEEVVGAFRIIFVDGATLRGSFAGPLLAP
jgi:hypothetical protein